MGLNSDMSGKLDRIVAKARKELTVRFGCLFNAKPFTIAEKLNQGFSDAFEKVHDKNLEVRNLRCKITIKGFSLGEDLGGKNAARIYEVRKAFEKRFGLELRGFDVLYMPVDSSTNELPNWTFHFTFYDVDPTDPMTGTPAWEFYR